jgi:hypothetical protein
MTFDEFLNLKKLPFFKGEIITGSMEPLIPVGTTITVAVNHVDLKRFDIIVFYLDGKLICHFLWQMNKNVKPILMQTRNLLNLGHDYPIKEENYLGKVVSHKLRLRDKMRILLNFR